MLPQVWRLARPQRDGLTYLKVAYDGTYEDAYKAFASKMLQTVKSEVPNRTYGFYNNLVHEKWQFSKENAQLSPYGSSFRNHSLCQRERMILRDGRAHHVREPYLCQERMRTFAVNGRAHKREISWRERKRTKGNGLASTAI